MEKSSLENKIEAILFWKGEPVSIKKLSQILEKSEEEISVATQNLEKTFENRGLVLVRKEDEVTLGTAKEVSGLIEKLTKEELIKDLGRAGLETLSIIIYQGPITRAEIDYIRGVQSTFILRNLMIRGLVEKIQNPKDQRSFLYKPTFELLSYLGLSKIEDMPEFTKAKIEIKEFKNSNKIQEENQNTENKNEVENQTENLLTQE